MSNTTPAVPTYLTNGQSSAVQILVGINLNKTSGAFEQEAKELLAGKALEPQKIGNFTRHALFAKNTMIADGMTVEAQIEANKIMKAHGLIS